MLGGAFVLLILAQAAEMRLAQSRMPGQRAKAMSRIGEMRDLAARIREELPAGAGLMCITPNESNSKTILAGAAYLARVPIRRYLDVHGDMPENQAMPRQLHTFVYKTLASQVASQWNAVPRFAAGDFTVLSPPASVATRGELPELDSD